MYKEKWLNYYFPQKPIRVDDKWTLLRKIGQKQLSGKAQLRLEWIIFFEAVVDRNVKRTASHFGISRKTFHKWLKRFNERNLKTLEEKSRRPKIPREWMVTKIEEERIIALRKKNMELGKKKLQILYERKYQGYISTWKIERVIRRYSLYPDLVKHRYRVRRRQHLRPKIRIDRINDTFKKMKTFGFLWHIDAIIIWWYGQRRVIFTALENLTKIAFARVYTTNKSGFADDFLKRLMYLVEGKVDIIHSDNGAEFQGVFERACKTLGILQVYSRTRTPQDNSSLEKFNSTIQQEWLNLSKTGLDNIDKANHDLTRWLIKYNSYRPHQALYYQTPLEYAQENFFKVLPMWSARTNY